MTFISDLTEVPNIPAVDLAPEEVSDKVIKAYSLRRYSEWDQDELTRGASWEICEYGYTKPVGTVGLPGYMCDMYSHIEDKELEGPYGKELMEIHDKMKKDNAKMWMTQVVDRGITTICTKLELENFFKDVRVYFKLDEWRTEKAKIQKTIDQTTQAMRLAVFKFAEALENDVSSKVLYYQEETKFFESSKAKPVLCKLMTMKEFLGVMDSVYYIIYDIMYKMHPLIIPPFPNDKPTTAPDLRAMMKHVIDQMESFSKMVADDKEFNAMSKGLPPSSSALAACDASVAPAPAPECVCSCTCAAKRSSKRAREE